MQILPIVIYKYIHLEFTVPTAIRIFRIRFFRIRIWIWIGWIWRINWFSATLVNETKDG